MPTNISECSNCACSSHQIIAAGGCPKRSDARSCPPCTGDCNQGRACPSRFIPAGRPLIPGQDATPHAGKCFRGLVWAVLIVLAAWGAAITFAIASGS